MRENAASQQHVRSHEDVPQHAEEPLIFSVRSDSDTSIAKLIKLPVARRPAALPTSSPSRTASPGTANQDCRRAFILGHAAKIPSPVSSSEPKRIPSVPVVQLDKCGERIVDPRGPEPVVPKSPDAQSCPVIISHIDRQILEQHRTVATSVDPPSLDPGHLNRRMDRMFIV